MPEKVGEMAKHPQPMNYVSSENPCLGRCSIHRLCVYYVPPTVTMQWAKIKNKKMGFWEGGGGDDIVDIGRGCPSDDILNISSVVFLVRRWNAHHPSSDDIHSVV